MTVSDIAPLIALVCFAGLVFATALSDILYYVIPNRLCLAIAFVYPSFVLAAPKPVDWTVALGFAAAILALGVLLYSVRACGAGDAKFFAVVALWAGPDLILPFVIYTTLAGGVMALFMWGQHRYARAPSLSLALHAGTDQAFLRQPMPYGAAIAVGALYVAFTLLRVS
jgi:prepilin peptidase CpaA